MSTKNLALDKEKQIRKEHHMKKAIAASEWETDRIVVQVCDGILLDKIKDLNKWTYGVCPVVQCLLTLEEAKELLASLHGAISYCESLKTCDD